MKTRVVLVDDQELLRAGVRLALERSEDLEVVAEAADCASGSDAIVATTPDVLVLDMSLPDSEGLALLETCREHSPATRVLALSSHQSREWADRAIEAGCAGYLDKTVGIAEIAPAVQAILRGRTIISLPGTPRPSDSVFAHDGAHPTPPQARHGGVLSEREREVLACLARGLTNQQAADELFLSVKTVETYRSRLTRKLGLRGRSELFAYAQQHGLVAEASPTEV